MINRFYTLEKILKGSNSFYLIVCFCTIMTLFLTVLFEIIKLKCPYCLFLPNCETFLGIHSEIDKNSDVDNTRFLFHIFSSLLSERKCCEYANSAKITCSESSSACLTFLKINLNLNKHFSDRLWGKTPTTNEKCVSAN